MNLPEHNLAEVRIHGRPSTKCNKFVTFGHDKKKNILSISYTIDTLVKSNTSLIRLDFYTNCHNDRKLILTKKAVLSANLLKYNCGYVC